MERRTSTLRSRIVLADADRRLHRDQTQELQEMVLQHVLERSDAVVVAGSALQRQRFVPRMFWTVFIARTWSTRKIACSGCRLIEGG
jgi:hypothetical protein